MLGAGFQTGGLQRKAPPPALLRVDEANERHPRSPFDSPNSPNSESGKLKTDDKRYSTASTEFKMPEVLNKFRQRLNLLGCITSLLVVIFTFHFGGAQQQPALFWLIFGLIVASLMFGFLQSLLPTSATGINLGAIGVRFTQVISIVLAGVLTRGQNSEILLALPIMSMFSGENTLLLEFSRGIISIGYLFQKDPSPETYAVVAISYLDGLFYLITSAVMWQVNLSRKPEKRMQKISQPLQQSEPTQTFTVAPQTLIASEPSLRGGDFNRRDIEASEVKVKIKPTKQNSSYGDMSEGISDSPSALPPHETHKLNNPMYRERKSTQIHLFERPVQMNSRKSTYNKRNQKVVINFNLATQAEGLQHARSHDPKKDGTALDLPIPARYTSNRGSSQNEFRFENDSDRRSTISPRSLSVFETKYMSLINQIVLACDESLNIIYNNYHERFYPTILKKMASSINIANFRSTGSDLASCFTQGAEYLKTDESTIKMINRLSTSLGIDFTDLETDSSVKSNRLLNFFQVIRSQVLKTRKRTERYQMKRMKHNLEASKNMPKSLELLEVSITIHDVLRFLSWFFAASSIEFHGLNFPVSLRFYIHTSIQIQFTLVMNQGRYLVYLSFECVEDKLALGETNNKLNYSYLLLCSLSHELLTPLNQLMLISEQLAKKIDSSTIGARRHLEIKPEGSTPSTNRNSVVNYSGSLAKMVEDSAHINLMARGLSLTVQNFLDFAKYIIRTLKVVPRPLDLAKVVADTVRIVQLKLQKKGLSVKVDVQCDPQMVSDEDKLTGLLYTFLDNAVKYTQHGGVSLTVKAGQTADHLRFEVADTGIGIDEEDMFKISSILENPFVDLKTRYSAGIGIGLRVAQVLIMYLSGGDIELNVSSLKGHGTTISFEILRHAKPLADGFLQQLDEQGSLHKSKPMEDFSHGGRNRTRKFSKKGFSLMRDSDPPQELIQEVVITEQSPIPSPGNMVRFASIAPSIQEHEIDASAHSTQKMARTGFKRLTTKNSMGTNMSSLRSYKKANLVTTSIVIKSIPKVETRNSQTLERDLAKSEISIHQVDMVPMDSPKSNPGSLEELHQIDLFGDHRRSLVKKTALIVDDEVLNCELVRDVLEDYEIEVFTAFDGEAALEQCLTFLTFNKKLDIIFMDYSMPLMNGDACAQRLRSSKFDPILKDTPIVGLTAHRDDQIASKCLAAGMTMIEYKPITNMKLSIILQKYQIINIGLEELASKDTFERQVEECEQEILQESPLRVNLPKVTSSVKRSQFAQLPQPVESKKSGRMQEA